MQAKPRPRRALAPAFVVALVGVTLLVSPRFGIVGVNDTAGPLPTFTPGAAELLAVGDIGSCKGDADEAVAALAARLPGMIALLGDIAYENGSPGDYATCFDPAWGALRSRIRPAPGNHDYQTTDATGYFSYFGAAAGTPGQGWYSYELGSWHVIVLNSNCADVGGCGEGSPQLAWLQADLLAHPTACTLVYWHHPRYSSGRHGTDARTDSLWRALATANADVVLSGHDHDYERRAPVDGIRSFVVGTGGRSLYELGRPAASQTELRANHAYGLLALELGDGSYRWQFVPIPGDTLNDSGTGSCR